MREGFAAVIESQRQQFLLWVPILLGLGIGVYFALPREPNLPAMTVLPIIALSGICALSLRSSVLRIPLLALLLIATGLCLALLRTQSVAAPVLSAPFSGAVEGRIIGIDRSQSNRLRLRLDQVKLYGLAPSVTPASVRVSVDDDAADLPAGTRILVQARLNGPSGPVEPGGFDFRRHAWFMTLGGLGYAQGPVMRASNQPARDWRVWLLETRLSIARTIRRHLPEEEGGFAAAVLTGDRSGIDPASLDALRASNLAHLLAISGLHMGLLTGLAFAFARYGLAAIAGKSGRIPVKKLAALAAILVGAVYLGLSGGAVATQRAFIMVCVALIAVMLERPALSLRAVAVAATLILIMRPESLNMVGFQMSFAATIGLIVGFAALRDHRVWAMTGQSWTHKVFRWALALVLSSSLAGAATAPFSAFHFNQIAQYGLLANVLAVPLMGMVVMPASLIAAFVAPLGLEGLALSVAGVGIAGILAVARFVAGLEGALVLVPNGSAMVLPLLVAGGFGSR